MFFFSFLKEHLAHCKVVHCISRFEGTSYKKLQDIATSSFISCCFTPAFTSADIIFYNFLNLIQNYQKKKKKKLSQISLLKWIHPNPPPILHPHFQNSISVSKIFCCTYFYLNYDSKEVVTME